MAVLVPPGYCWATRLARTRAETGPRAAFATEPRRASTASEPYKFPKPGVRGSTSFRDANIIINLVIVFGLTKQEHFHRGIH